MQLRGLGAGRASRQRSKASSTATRSCRTTTVGKRALARRRSAGGAPLNRSPVRTLAKRRTSVPFGLSHGRGPPPDWFQPKHAARAAG
jgi:hypothetical protein